MKICSVALLTAGAVIITSPASCVAEEAIKIDNVKNELLKKSLSKSQESAAAGASSEISETDLDVADRRLKAAEQRLLQKAGSTGGAPAPKPAFAADQAAPAAPNNAAAKAPAASIKNPQSPPTAQRASLDVQKLTPEVVSGPAAAIDRPASIKIAGAPVEASAPQIAELTQKNALLEKDLKDANERANALAKELDETRNRLMIAETQVERLSVIIESRGKSPAMSQPPTAARDKVVRTNSISAPDDAQIATVVADKVHLRTGPGKENSPLMAVTKGTKLTVETRSGDWYRVIAPTGRRAWISGDVVAFGVDSRTNFGQTSRIKGFDNDLEDGSSESQQ